MIRLTGLHLLTTYQCTLECDHCFVWGSPWQTGTMTLGLVRRILEQADDLGTVETIFFEGGEPFLYYAHLLESVKAAADAGYSVGIVSNGYWATSEDDALACLKPFGGLVTSLSISSDLFHWNEEISSQAVNATAAADKVGIPIGVISIAGPNDEESSTAVGELPTGRSGVMYRGRAAQSLAADAASEPWHHHTRCSGENLRDPGRVHIDPLGNVHICQGLSLGNLHETPLSRIAADYVPEEHPIVGPLLSGGPAELVRTYNVPHDDAYSDECHLCDDARRRLRGRFGHILCPEQMYGSNGS